MAIMAHQHCAREQSKGLVTNYGEGGYKTEGGGGYKTGGGREVFTPKKRGEGGGGRKSFSHAK